MNRRPWIACGLLLGAGLGGFFDGIVFHQLLQWHNMLSARLPTVTLLNAKVNMFWDGVFHAAVWLMTVSGLWCLFHAGQRTDIPPNPGGVLAGGMAWGWGLFNLVEGLIDHHLLGLHHVREDLVDPFPADLAFLASGVLLCLFGVWLLRRSAACERRSKSDTIRW